MKSPGLLFAGLFFLSIYTAFAQKGLWSIGMGGPLSEDKGDMITTASGVSYIAGSFQGSGRFGNILKESGGGFDYFIARINKDGTVAWVHTSNGQGDEKAKAIAMDAEGNLLITGTYEGNNCKIGFRTINSMGGTDVFILKLTPDNEILWNQEVAGTDQDLVYDIHSNSMKEIALAGQFKSTMRIRDVYDNTTYHYISKYSSGSDFDGFFILLETNGSYTGSKVIGSPGNDNGIAVKADLYNNFYISGTFTGTINLGGTSLTSNGASDIFLTKLARKNLSYSWAKRLGSSSTEDVASIALEEKGQILMAGNFKGSLPTGLINLSSSGLYDIFLVKYANNGSVVWASKYGGANNDRVQKVKLDKAKNIYLTGGFETSTHIGTIGLSGFSASDILITRLDSLGNPVWAKSIGSSLVETPAGIGIDKDTSLYISGVQSSSLTIGNDTTEFFGNTDVFVTRWIQKDPLVFTFSGNGKWSLPSNWYNEMMPPPTLPAGDSIIIRTLPGDSCILDTEQVLAGGSTLIVDANSHLVVNGNINVIPQDSTFTDPRDGKEYTIQTYGSQVWMTMNLNYHATASLVYNNDPANAGFYGRLYDWNTAMGAAPPGWHVPSYEEWIKLIQFAGSAGALKDTVFWNQPNVGATNRTGFNARAGGKFDEPDFKGLGFYASFWTSKQTSIAGTSNTAVSLSLLHSSALESWYSDEWKWTYLSVRCVKNQE